MQRKRKIKALHLCEISCVDRPAHELALATLVKSAKPLEYEPEPLGNIGEDTMDTKALEMQISKLTADLITANGEIAGFIKVMALSAESRAAYDSLDIADKTAYLDGSEAIRKSLSDAIANRNPIVYMAEDGTVYHKSDDTRLVTFAKKADEAMVAQKAAEKALEDKRLFEEAKKISFIPGTDESRVKLVRAVESLGEEGKAILGHLVKMSEIASDDFEFIGKANEPLTITDKESAEVQLDTLTKALVEKTGETYAKSYAKVLDTEAGRALFRKLC
jgi:hypothetical protein